ncbi:MAG: hypothetical protein FJ095_06445 [Deltaproteobacteria bacterium]|nr:hypothetical protein [Deltaproteobacteria bacterium]
MKPMNCGAPTGFCAAAWQKAQVSYSSGYTLVTKNVPAGVRFDGGGSGSSVGGAARAPERRGRRHRERGDEEHRGAEEATHGFGPSSAGSSQSPIFQRP